MRPFRKLVGTGVPMPQANIDTDQILPSRFMQKPRAEGFGRYLFHDLRFDKHGVQRPGFILNRPEHRGAEILIGGANFGCGSSREQAVYAIADGGFQAVIAPSFGDIFHANALKNGLLPVVLDGELVELLAERCAADPTTRMSIDLEAETFVCGNLASPFPIDAFRKRLLLAGQDEIGLTLDLDDAIAAFERRRSAESGWL
jgi:3-isopropylmalate/(R)-2-methylmalate dehydratase small subunit